MHEFSLMANLLKKVEETVKHQKAKRAIKLKVKLGALSHISPSHFTEHFEQGAINTVAEGAELDIKQETDEKADDATEIILESIELAFD